jgi:hypothetical protein
MSSTESTTESTQGAEQGTLGSEDTTKNAKVVLELVNGTKYEQWNRFLVIEPKNSAPFSLAFLEAPLGEDTSHPYVFMYVDKDGPVEKKGVDLLFLAIEIAHIWANGVGLDELTQAAVGVILTTAGFHSIDRNDTPMVINALIEGVLKGRM